MFTGYTSHEVGLARNNVPMADSLRTASLGWLVQNAGYECAYAGKWHVHTPSMPDKEFGFSAIYPHNDNGLAEVSVAFLDRKHSKPFFLVVGFDNPHNICEYAVARICRLAICPNSLKMSGPDCLPTCP